MEMARERARLGSVLQLLRRTQSAAERTAPAPSDPRGEVLRMLLAWRRRRAAAIEAEMGRLGDAIASGGGPRRFRPDLEL